MKDFLLELRPALRMLLALSLMTGVAYPALVTALAQLLLPHAANGSLIRDAGGQVRGSEQVGQAFAEARYFWGRPSATAPMPYNAAASTGSNLGPLNPALEQAVQGRIAALMAHPHPDAPLPVDLVTASASGLDPHISPAAALWQLPRVAAARGLDPARLRTWVEANTEGRQWGLLGEPRVNVLRLNLALDQAVKP